MKKAVFSLLTLLILISCNQQEDQKRTIGNLEITGAKPQAGKTLDIRYTRDSLSENPEAIAYYLTGRNHYPQDVSLSKKESVYEGQLEIPDSASAVIINFKNGDTYDDNDKKAYVLPVYNENGEEKPGAKIAEAWFKFTRGSQFGYDIPADSAYAIMNKAYKENPELIREAWMETFISLAARADKEQADTLMQEQITALSKKQDLDQKDYSTLKSIYDLKENKKASDSIVAIARKHYPKGDLSKYAYIMEMQKASSPQEKEEVLKRYEEEVGTASGEKDYLLNTVAGAYLEKDNYEKYEEYMNAMQDPLRKASSYNNVAWEMAGKDENLEQAAALSKESLDLVEKAKNDPEAKPDYYSKSQFNTMLAGSKKMYADTYAFIFFKQGNINEAIKYQEMAITDGAGADGYERYLQFLIANEDYDKVLNKGEEFIKNNRATKKTREYYLTAYNKVNPDAKDAEARLADLEAVGEEKAIAELQERMIDEEAPQFSLTNLEGDKVALSKLKGKTVILDFWATWCGPCKVSFPGMQMAVDNYRDNPDVQFLFIDTWESTSGTEREESVKQFIAENEYSFNVLMDTPVEEGSRNYEVVEDYNVSGIPTKFVIGPDGRIKFKAVGYDGNTEALAEEIEMMVNLVQTKSPV